MISQDAQLAPVAAPPSSISETDQNKAKLAYLLDMYKMYHGHINTMFNYFLILAGFIANAYVVSIQKNADINPIVPTAIGVLGCLISIISWLIHLRSRELMDTIEKGLHEQEKILFSGAAGFLNVSSSSNSFYKRHKYQFQSIYAAFALMFCLAALLPSRILRCLM